MKVVNIRVIYKSNADSRGFCEQKFSNWYDFADWLKQQNEAEVQITISRWLYVTMRL